MSWDTECETIFRHCQKKAIVGKYTVIDPATEAFGQWLLRAIEPEWKIWLCRVDETGGGKDPVSSFFLSPEKEMTFLFSVIISELENRFECWKWESPNPFLAIIDNAHEELTIIPLPGETAKGIIDKITKAIVPF